MGLARARVPVYCFFSGGVSSMSAGATMRVKNMSHANETLLRVAIENWLGGMDNWHPDYDLDTPAANCPVVPPPAGESK